MQQRAVAVPQLSPSPSLSRPCPDTTCSKSAPHLRQHNHAKKRQTRTAKSSKIEQHHYPTNSTTTESKQHDHANEQRDNAKKQSTQKKKLEPIQCLPQIPRSHRYQLGVIHRGGPVQGGREKAFPRDLRRPRLESAVRGCPSLRLGLLPVLRELDWVVAASSALARPALRKLNKLTLLRCVRLLTLTQHAINVVRTDVHTPQQSRIVSRQRSLLVYPEFARKCVFSF